MDTGNDAVGDVTMESGDDWRCELQRERIVNKIMATLKRHLPFSKYERLQELKKIAERVEHEIYTAATSKSEYLRKICFLMLTMQTRLQTPMSDPTSVPLDSTANGEDWQEEVYQKIKAMKDLYLLDLESGDWKAQLPADTRQKIVNTLLDYLKRYRPSSGHEELHDIVVWLEEKAYDAATTQFDYLRKISIKILKMEARFRDSMSDPLQSNSAANSVKPSVPLVSIAQTGNRNPNGEDWQEEAYQKIKAMKDLYLLDLNNIQQKVLSKLQQLDSLPQQKTNEQHERLKTYKNMLERFMQFLQTPKHEILPIDMDMLGPYEMQMIKVINICRPVAPQQQAQALPPPHTKSLQKRQQTHSQPAQVELHGKQMKLQASITQKMQYTNMRIKQENQQSSTNLLPTQAQSHPQLQQQNVIDMQKRLCPQKRAMPEASSRSLDSTSQSANPDDGEWRKIKTTKDMESGDWRAQLQADKRQKIVNIIMGTLKRHLPFSGHKGLQELKKIAVRFEEKTYTAAPSQSDYSRKIAVKMLTTMEKRSQNLVQSNSTANSVNPSDTGVS